MREKQRGIISFFELLNHFLCWLAFRLWNIVLCGKYTQLSADHRVIWPVPDLFPPPPRNRYVTRIFPVVPAHSLPNQLYGYPSLPIRFHAAERNICLKNIGQKLKPSYVAISTILSLSCLLFTSFLFLLLCFVFIYLRLQHFRYAHAYWLIGSYAATYNTASLVLQDYPWNA